MKISICIPVFNIDISSLVSALEKEIEQKQLNAEIVIIDDASTNQDIQKNNRKTVNQHFYLELKQNVGRSKIRNLFVNYAQGEYFLFLDCDGLVINPDFISNYLEFINTTPNVNVIYGGRVVSKEIPDTNYLLRWMFAHQRENPPLHYRSSHSYLCFQTNNFLIKKEVFEKIQFEDQLNRYGYEDVLFSFELKKKGIKINHIDNPIFNNDVESNKAYLSHVEESVDNVAWLLKQAHYREDLKQIKLIKAYCFLRKCKLTGIYKMIMQPFKNKLKLDLEGRAISLRKLDLYKLLLLVEKE